MGRGRGGAWEDFFRVELFDFVWFLILNNHIPLVSVLATGNICLANMTCLIYNFEIIMVFMNFYVPGHSLYYSNTIGSTS